MTKIHRQPKAKQPSRQPVLTTRQRPLRVVITIGGDGDPIAIAKAFALAIAEMLNKGASR